MTSCSACTAGYQCKPGSTTPTPTNSECPYGTYCNGAGNVNPTSCPSGEYLPYRGESTDGNCQDCQAGYYCPKGSWEQFVCPPGHYCGSKVEHPTQCNAGSWNPTYYATAQGDCDPCPAGYYCKAGTTSPIKCPAGWICELNSIDYTTAKCGAGTYSGGESIGSSGDCKTCPMGHYCPIDSADATSISVFPIPCPAGTFSSATGNTQASDCQECSSGRVCPYLGN